jgi:hypothetical protein
MKRPRKTYRQSVEKKTYTEWNNSNCYQYHTWLRRSLRGKYKYNSITHNQRLLTLSFMRPSCLRCLKTSAGKPFVVVSLLNPKWMTLYSSSWILGCKRMRGPPPCLFRDTISSFSSWKENWWYLFPLSLERAVGWYQCIVILSLWKSLLTTCQCQYLERENKTALTSDTI